MRTTISSGSHFHLIIHGRDVMNVRSQLFISVSTERWSRNQQLPLNVVERVPITYFSFNFQQYKDLYDFYDEKIVDQFFDSIYERFVTGGYFKMHGCI